MRDPLAPIPSPSQNPAYWECTTTPRTTEARYPAVLEVDVEEIAGASEVDVFEPLRLLDRNAGDSLGIDRRSRRRHGLAQGSATIEHGGARLISAAHRPLRRVLGLTSAHGWALVHTLSITATGVLVHLLDLLRGDLDDELALHGRGALRRLAPVLPAPIRPRAIHPHGSPLATVGGCILAPRVIADLSSWASHPTSRRGSSLEPSTAHAVTLLMPTADGEPILRMRAELVPMTDPQPEVLALALSPLALGRLGSAVAEATRA
ncbi:MAG: hypothetical protein R3B09_19530 [Nannocystaceae bacterium]